VTTNVIDGDITAEQGPPSPSIENNLLNVMINGDQDFYVDGDIIFNSIEEDKDTATLIINNTATTTVHGDLVVDTSDVSYEAGAYSYLGSYDYIDTLNIINNGGPLVVEGASPAINANGELEVINLSGTGDMSFGTAAGAVGLTAESLSVLNASGLDGDLDLGTVNDVDDTDFTFTAGEGQTLMTFAGDELNVSEADGDGIDPADENGWTFDFGDAGANSELHLDSSLTFTKGPLNIDLGAKTTLFIDGAPGALVDLTDIDLTILQTLDIVLADEVELLLTADQADGLNIVGVDTDGDGTYGTVNIVDLGDYNDTNANGKNDDPAELVPYNFSGIAPEIAGMATLFDDDVTLHGATDLGAFGIELKVISNDDDNKAGQTIRFNSETQADERVIDVVSATGYANPATDGDYFNSTNVIWLFESITGTLDTGDYDDEVGRLWFSEALANGANAEQLFSTLPNTILRVDFADLTDLEEQLISSPVDRIIELASFTSLDQGLIFSDEDQLEHLQSLTVKMGGQVTVGDQADGTGIMIGNIVDPETGVVPGSIVFNSLTVESWLADDTGDLLARENFDEEAQVKPVGPNVIGDIGIGNDQGNAFGLDLTDVTLDTGVDESANDLAADSDSLANVLTGTALEIGTITYDAEVAATGASLTVSGANDIDIASVNTADPDILWMGVTYDGFSATLTAPGASPAFFLGDEPAENNTEALIFDTTDDTTTSATVLGSDVNAGVVGDDLSLIDASDYIGEIDLGVLALIDGTDDEAFDYNGDGDTNDDYEDANIAFELIGNGTEDTTWATLGTANGFTPSLAAGSTWQFDDVRLTLTDTAILNAGSTLALDDMVLVIDGDVDLSEITIDISGATKILVPEGSSLILTIDQLNQADMVDITGEGTLKVVGEANADEDINNGGHIKTVGVDISGVTVPAADADGELNLILGQPTDDDEVAGGPDGDLGHDVTGSAVNDNIVTGDGDDTIDGAEGDDDLTGGAGVDTFNITAGTDTISDLNTTDIGGPNEASDVLVVSAGATVDATVIADGWIATEASSNAGVATLTGPALDGTLIDASLAGTLPGAGTEGFTITALANLAGNNGAKTLIGSDYDDVINGGDSLQNTAARAICLPVTGARICSGSTSASANRLPWQLPRARWVMMMKFGIFHQHSVLMLMVLSLLPLNSEMTALLEALPSMMMLLFSLMMLMSLVARLHLNYLNVASTRFGMALPAP